MMKRRNRAQIPDAGETHDNDDDDMDDNDVDNFKSDDDTAMVPQHFVPESIGYVLIRVPCPPCATLQLCKNN